MVLEGIRLKAVKRFVDERGFFCEVMRSDWRDLFEEDTIVQANHSFTYPQVIRAWHRHNRGQVDYFLVLKGSVKICVFGDKTAELDEICSSGLELQLVRVPGHYWHGFKAIGDEPAMLLYFTNRHYDPAEPDEERRDWNDPTLIPQSVNGDKKDVRVGKKWDWNYPPNK